MNTRMQIAIAATAAGLVGGGAVAVAQTSQNSPAAEREAFLENAADRLGVEPDDLATALEEAAIARVDAAVAAGRMTEEQAKEVKERIRAGEAGVPGTGFGPGMRGGPGSMEGGPGFMHSEPGFLEPAVSYLGLAEDELRERLDAGDSLADVAKSQDKSVDGLVNAIVTSVDERLDQDNQLEESQRKEMLDHLRERITDLVQNALPPPGQRGPGDRA